MGLFAIIRAVLELFGFASREVHDAEQRKAGSDASQVEAMNAENDRITRASNAANTANSVPNGQVDPNDRSGK